LVELLGDGVVGDGPEGPIDGECLELGPVSLKLDLPALRALSWGKSELIHAIVMAVRDRNWGTVPPRLTVLENQVSGTEVSVRFACVHESHEVGFSWEGAVRARVTSGRSCTVTYEMVGRATRAFLANRVGLCVLHPLSVIGQSVALRSISGTSEGRFPVEIVPWQPFLELTGMGYEVDGARADIAFEGELFETEDQRNWTDASFKTYCPPLHIPYPRSLRAGEEVAQKVVIELDGVPVPTKPRRRSAHLEVRVGTVGRKTLPQIGAGLGKAHQREDVKRVGGLLAQLGPAHLHVVVEPALPDWERNLRGAVEAASDAHASLQLEVVADDADSLEAVSVVVADCAKGSQSNVGAVMLFDGSRSVTTRPLATAWQSFALRLGLPALIYGGSRANFTELNRNTPPLDLLSGLTFALNPQVHAFSTDEIAETIPVQQLVAQQAAAMAPDLRLHVGPVTLQPRFNAVATDPGARPEPAPDPRLSSLWAAAWTLGSVAALTQGGAQELTFFEALGDRAIMPTGQTGSRSPVYPVCEVLRQLCVHHGDAVLDAQAVQAGVLAVLGVSHGGDLTVFVSNLSSVAHAVQVEDVGASFTRTSLDVTMAEKMAKGIWERPTGRPVRSRGFELAPHEVTILTSASRD
jgi:hypothetical protein